MCAEKAVALTAQTISMLINGLYKLKHQDPALLSVLCSAAKCLPSTAFEPQVRTCSLVFDGVVCSSALRSLRLAFIFDLGDPRRRLHITMRYGHSNKVFPVCV